MGYQWDTAKDVANREKHGIGFLQAAQVFRGPVLTREDDRRPYGETRFVYTERDGDVRIISARKANRHERETYRATLDRARGEPR